MIVITSFLGMFAISASLEGYTVKPINMVVRILLAVAGLMMLYPGTLTDVIGIGTIAVIMAVDVMQTKKQKAQA